jgi:hypothetical protein
MCNGQLLSLFFLKQVNASVLGITSSTFSTCMRVAQLTLSQQAIFFTTSDILIELFYNVNISARIHPPLKQRTPLKS